MEPLITPFDTRLLDQLSRLPPYDWNVNPYELFMQNEWQPWFFPYQIKVENKLVSFGLLWIFGETAWLGWILVDKKFRNQGLGRAMTEHLMQQAKGKGARNIILTATAMGYPLYLKMGFEVTGSYLFFKSGKPVRYRYDTSKVRPITREDLTQIGAIDREATGENRSKLLNHLLPEGWVHENNGKVEGFFLEKLGNGFIAAETETAGLNLLLFASRRLNEIVIGESNEAVKDLLIKKGFTEFKKIPRMALNGNDAPWNQCMVYNRGGGYCG
jgi:GNAT superfamily N-acetyltransferase